MKTHEPQIDVLKVKKSIIPFSDELCDAAEKIAESAIEASDQGKMGGVELAGHISMAALLKSCSEGSIPLKQAFTLLKGIAEKKTPDPVVRIEARQEIDMRAILYDAVERSPRALQDIAAISLATREQVRIKIGAANNKLELKPLPQADRPEAVDAEVEEAVPINDISELSYDLRKMDFDEALKKGDDRLEQMLDSEAEGVVYRDVKTNDNNWNPGDEPNEIRQLRESKRGAQNGEKKS